MGNFTGIKLGKEKERIFPVTRVPSPFLFLFVFAFFQLRINVIKPEKNKSNTV